MSDLKPSLHPIGFRPKMAVVLATLLLAGPLLSACATPPKAGDAEALAEYKAVNDPLEPLNRATFFVNEGLDTFFVRPAATFYKAMTPPPIQKMVHNFLNNIRTPIILLNDLLQDDPKRAGDTATRFAINTTIGILGLRDPASAMGYARHSEDFGQTLSVWGLKEGPYLVLPIIGPSNPRDAVGYAVDYVTDPINIWVHNTGRQALTTTRSVASAIDFRARNMNEINDLQKTSLDYYVAVRTLYRQVRSNEIRNGATPFSNGLPSMGSTQTPHTQTAVVISKN